MLPDGAIRTEHLWKRFKADHRLLLRDEIQRLAHFLRGDRNGGWRWVLKDVGFNIEPGESVGLIGINGSGKTTLLKILSQVMFPYAGRIETGGRVGALINVTGGLHEDLTGKENIFIYGSLLGWKRRHVAEHFSDIVDFAELGNAIDRQVKFYSQGMKMRLAFAIAAMLEPNVLLVDEVLAVGDAWFQKKCLERMQQILEAGTTIVYVSHDLATVQAMCSRTMWMSDGHIVSDGESASVIEQYLRSLDNSLTVSTYKESDLSVNSIGVSGQSGRLLSGDQMSISLKIQSKQEVKGTMYLGGGHTAVAPSFVVSHDIALSQGLNSIDCKLMSFPLSGGTSNVWVGFIDRDGKTLIPFQPVANFEVQGPPPQQVPAGIVMGSSIYVPSTWTVTGAVATGRSVLPGSE